MIALLFCWLQVQDGDAIHLLSHPFRASLGEPVLDASWRSEPGPEDPYRIMLLHFRSSLSREEHVALGRAGIVLLSYIPHNAWVARVDVQAELTHEKLDFSCLYHAAFKLHPVIDRQAPASLLAVRLHPGMNLEPVRQFLAARQLSILSEVDFHDLQRLVVYGLSPGRLLELAQLPQVALIAPVPARVERNDRTRWIIQSYEGGAPGMTTPFYDAGLHGEGEIVGVIDGRVDVNHCLFLDANPIGPSHRKLQYLSSAGSSNSHGTHVAGSVAGQNGTGSLTDAGMAYEARLAFTTSLGNQSGQLLNTFLVHETHGARIHTNSWGEVDGSPGATSYTMDCEDIDTFMYQNEDNLVLFACMNDTSFPLAQLLSPENALNVLAVGATEAGTANPAQLAERHGSCRTGPTVLDGRRKPEIFAPGCGLISAQNSSSCNRTSMCGTSMATPVTAGAAALVRQYFREGFYPSGVATPADSLVPSGALLKAALLVGTVNMIEDTPNGGGYIDTPLPNNVEGWGRVNLDRSLHLQGQSKRLWVEDVWNASGLTTGQQSEFSLNLVSSAEPLRVCLVFTVPPAAAGSSHPVSNDLDLELVSPGGTTYLGNQFSAGYSIAGGSPDPLNNVEQVWIASPQTGSWTIRVKANAVPVGLQGFALAATGALSTQPTLNLASGGAIACWGDATTLSGQVVGCSPDVVQWTPSTGLSDPGALLTNAAPLVTTTYTLSVQDNGGTCSLQAQITVEVPAMDVDGTSLLDGADLLALLPAFPLRSTEPGWTGVEERDFDGDGAISILDLLRLMGCL